MSRAHSFDDSLGHQIFRCDLSKDRKGKRKSFLESKADKELGLNRKVAKDDTQYFMF